MTKQEQCEFVVETLASVSSSIVDLILTGKIPPEWDGFELRWLIAEKVKSHVVMPVLGSKSQRRRKNFNNTVLVNNLV